VTEFLKEIKSQFRPYVGFFGVGIIVLQMKNRQQLKYNKIRADILKNLFESEVREYRLDL
jgi:hypothetical protein